MKVQLWEHKKMLVSIQVNENSVINIQDNQDYIIYQSNVHFLTTTSYIHQSTLTHIVKTMKVKFKNYWK